MSDSDNVMLISIDLSYAESIALPYEDGINLLRALKRAKIYSQPYQEPITVTDLSTKKITSNIIGAQEYGESVLRSTILGETKSK